MPQCGRDPITKQISCLLLSLSLVLGYLTTPASAAMQEPSDAKLIPYYTIGSNEATIIGLINAATGIEGVPVGTETVYTIGVHIHEPDMGEIVASSTVCLGAHEFGYVVIQDPRAAVNDTQHGVFFTRAEDGIPTRGFVTLVTERSGNSCGSGAALTAATENAMVAWTILQNVGTGFFGATIPVVNVDWQAPDPQDEPFAAFCYRTGDPDRKPVPSQLVEADPSATPPVEAGCKDPTRYTYVEAGTVRVGLNASADILPCLETGDTTCTGLANQNNADPAQAAERALVARFDLERSNRSRSEIYLWLDTAPDDERMTDEAFVVCQNKADVPVAANRIDISRVLNVINPASLGVSCSGRGTLHIPLPRRTEAVEYCHDSTIREPTDAQKFEADAQGMSPVLDAANNRCKTFTFSRDLNGDGSTTTDDIGCYERGETTTPKTAVPEAHRPRSADDPTVIGCKTFTYVPEVTQDNPSGYIFSHITQDTDHFRMNFPGYIAQ